MRANPSGVMMNPDPLPPLSRPLRPALPLRTSIFTTDGLTASAAFTTALEYASSNGLSGSSDASSLTGGCDAPVAGFGEAN